MNQLQKSISAKFKREYAAKIKKLKIQCEFAAKIKMCNKNHFGFAQMRMIGFIQQRHKKDKQEKSQGNMMR